MRDNPHYQAIQEHYGDGRANRSNQLFMNHIDEGLALLDLQGSSLATKEAFCLHPLLQIPNTLRDFVTHPDLSIFNPLAFILAMEYRNKANAYLCRPKTDHYTLDDLPVMVLPEVTQMLIADKVQNYKDFLQYHQVNHERSEQLDNYFGLWLQHLGVPDEILAYFIGQLTCTIEELVELKKEG